MSLRSLARDVVRQAFSAITGDIPLPVDYYKVVHKGYTHENDPLTQQTGFATYRIDNAIFTQAKTIERTAQNNRQTPLSQPVQILFDAATLPVVPTNGDRFTVYERDGVTVIGTYSVIDIKQDAVQATRTVFGEEV